jgi:hypothetical protein
LRGVVTVYVDNYKAAVPVANGARVVRGVWCHMTADTREELDAMADTIGMKRDWIQAAGTWKEHYDVTLTRRRRAVLAGAVEVSSLEHVRSFLLPRRRAAEALGVTDEA